MPFVYRLCLVLLVVPALASAESSRDEDRGSIDQFDCLIDPAFSGVVSCLPPYDLSAVDYQWEMGDGAVYTSDQGEPHIYHTYKEPGDYTVTLTVNSSEATLTSQSVLSIPELRENGTSSQLARGYYP